MVSKIDAISATATYGAPNQGGTRSYVVISRKALERLGRGEGGLLIVKTVNLDEMRRSPEGLKKLNKYLEEGRLAYFEASQPDLHLHSQKCQFLQDKNISQVTYKGSAHAVSQVAFTAIGEEEHGELKKQIDSELRASQEQERLSRSSKTPNKLTTPAALADAIVKALDIQSEEMRHATIMQLLNSWSEAIHNEEVRNKEKSTRELMDKIALEHRLLRHEILQKELLVKELLARTIQEWAVKVALGIPSAPPNLEQRRKSNAPQL